MSFYFPFLFHALLCWKWGKRICQAFSNLTVRSYTSHYSQGMSGKVSKHSHRQLGTQTIGALPSGFALSTSLISCHRVQLCGSIKCSLTQTVREFTPCPWLLRSLRELPCAGWSVYITRGVGKGDSPAPCGWNQRRWDCIWAASLLHSPLHGALHSASPLHGPPHKRDPSPPAAHTVGTGQFMLGAGRAHGHAPGTHDPRLPCLPPLGCVIGSVLAGLSGPPSH